MAKGEGVQCRLCGYKWSQRTDRTPIVCTRCKSYNWNNENNELETKKPVAGRKRLSKV
jgi:predicted Zn-ribbon and HTH transcriptional regulator